MRRVLSPIFLILLVTHCFASTFEILTGGEPGRLDNSDYLINIPAGTKGDVVGKVQLKDRSWVYEFEVSTVGPAKTTSLTVGSKFWFPCKDVQCKGIVEFRNAKGHITSKPTINDTFTSKKDANVRNTGTPAKVGPCPSTLDPKNASMLANQVDCLKKKTAPEQPIGENINPLFNEMLGYLNTLKPNQKSNNEKVARYTLEFASKKGISPLFLLSICKAESSFNPNAMSTFYRKDDDGNLIVGHAYGVCQLLKSTASSHAKGGLVTTNNLKDIKTNLDLATDEIADLMHMRTIKIPITGKNGQPVLNRHGQPEYTYRAILPKDKRPLPPDAIITMETPSYLDVLEAYNCGPACLAKIKGGGMNVPRATKNYAMDILNNLQDYQKRYAEAHLPTKESIN